MALGGDDGEVGFWHGAQIGGYGAAEELIGFYELDFVEAVVVARDY